MGGEVKFRARTSISLISMIFRHVLLQTKLNRNKSNNLQNYQIKMNILQNYISDGDNDVSKPPAPDNDERDKHENGSYKRYIVFDIDKLCRSAWLPTVSGYHPLKGPEGPAAYTRRT